MPPKARFVSRDEKSIMEFSVDVRGEQALIANFNSKNKAVQKIAKKWSRTTAEKIQERTRELVPYDEGNMFELVEIKEGEKGLVFEVGWYPETFEARGLRFYPPFVEYGTIYQTAQPSLSIAYAEIAPRAVPDLTASIRSVL